MANNALAAMYLGPLSSPRGESKDFLLDALREDAGKSDIESCKVLVRVLLTRLNVTLPSGVLVPFRGRPGRKRSDSTDSIFRKWIEIGQPSLTRQILARAHFGERFTAADSKGKELLVDQCRAAVLRCTTRLNRQAN
jgi:hypothetical protein